MALVVAASLVLLLTGGTGASTGDDQTAVPVTTRLVRLLSYFTVQSNLFVLVTSVTLALAPDRDGRVWRVLRLDALLGITVTGLVYRTLLAPVVDLQGAALVAGLGLHLVAPVGTLVVWWWFGPRPRITASTVRWAFLWPLTWVACTYVHGSASGWYPYPFVDAATLGHPRTLAAVAGVLVLGVLVVLVLRRLDRRAARPR